ncbi:CHAT domain-containing protein [Lewinella sp. IMCC34183]|uniref:CHAT domain-containing protein n=1 Tax=Lewinella sp. IMCC34183 TaxID=2248762 RepID=UPI000E21FCF5|nr:CHAT domain-containing protein [Lewinella sp. IMCC34183]
MQTYFILAVACLSLCAAGCHGRPEAPPLSKTDLALRDSLDLLRADYDSLRLWAALDRARRLRSRVEAAPTPVAPALLTELYQRLAMLHHEREYYEDSTTYYVRRAEKLLPAYADAHLRARQFFCRAYAKYYEWEWLEMDMLCALGQDVLQEAGLEHSVEYAQLLLQQSYARRKHIGSWLEGEARQEAWCAVEGLTRQGIDLLRKLGSPRLRQGYETLAHLILRLPDRRTEMTGLLDTMDQLAGTADPVFGYTDRLRGYLHLEENRLDSAQHYYRAFLTRDSVYRQYYIEEATSILARTSIQQNNFREGFTYLRTDRAGAGCDPTHPDASPAAAQRYSTKYICLYHELAFADAHLARYRHEGAAADMDTAYTLTQSALQQYQFSFPSTRESGVLNRMVELGGNLLARCLEVARLRATQRADPESLNAVLESMELGRALLLLRATASGGGQGPMRRIRRLQSSIGTYKAQYIATGYALERGKLDAFETKDREYLRAVRHLTNEESEPTGSLTAGDTLQVSEIQRELTPGQSLLQFAEGTSTLVGLYIDQDTAVAYPVEPSLSDSALLLVRYLSADTSLTAARYGELAHTLHCGLLGPAEAFAAGREEWLIVPPVALAELPFSALVTAGPGAAATFKGLDYVLDHHRIRYLNSWRTEVHRRTEEGQRPADYFSVAAFTHTGLHGYLGELGRKITSRNDRSGDDYGATVTNPARFLRLAARPRVLHLSMHARGNPEELEENYLFLSNQDSVSGVAIGSTPFRADLVVLAACSTGRGLSRRGEGTFSLSRSFHLAGVRDVVSSLYDIDAASTAAVLEQFYEHLFAGESVSHALVSAQRSCRRGGLNQRWSDPRSWSGLVVN